MRLTLVVAATPSGGIGMDGTLPWVVSGVRLPGDMAYFKKSTTATTDPLKRNAAVMGRRTWEGIPAKHRPLRDRLNVVVTRDAAYEVPDGVLKVSSLDEAVARLAPMPDVESLVVVGGVRLFEECLNHPLCDAIHYTAVEREFTCDTMLPPSFLDTLRRDFDHEDQPPVLENDVRYTFQVHTRRRPPPAT